LAKKLFILAKINHLTPFRSASNAVLTATVDLTGHYPVGALLESCLADKIAFGPKF
jgi:hypothetical protein